MKTLRVSNSVHDKLTRMLGEIMTKTGKPKTYNDVIDVLTAQFVIIPTELLEKIDTTVSTKQFGYKTREQFIEDAVTAMLHNFSGKIIKKL